MISQTINRRLLANFLLQDTPYLITWDMKIHPDSYLYRCCVQGEPVTPMVEEFLTVFDGETVKDVQKNINSALTCSKHFLMYHKQDLLWFQKSLARMKNARGAFKDRNRSKQGPVLA